MSEDHVILRGEFAAYVDGELGGLPGIPEGLVRRVLTTVDAAPALGEDEVILDIGSVTWDLLLMRDDDGRVVAVEGGVYLTRPLAAADVREVYRRIQVVAEALGARVWPATEDPEDAVALEPLAFAEQLVQAFTST